MLKIDLTKAFPVSAFRYLVAFIPGFFFTICITLGNPSLAAHLNSQLQIATPFSQYAEIFIVLFLAFVIGAVFMNVTSLILWVLVWVLMPFNSLRNRFRAHVLLPILNRFLKVNVPPPVGEPPKPKPNWLLNFRGRTIQRVFSPDAATRAGFRWWEAFAEKLLRVRYGMEESDLPRQTSWQPLIGVLMTPTREEVRGYLIVNALHATGWSGLTASRFAPSLHATWFLAFSYFLIGSGLLHDIGVAISRTNPISYTGLYLRAILREFPKPMPEAASTKGPSEEAEEEYNP